MHKDMERREKCLGGNGESEHMNELKRSRTLSFSGTQRWVRPFKDDQVTKNREM